MNPQSVSLADELRKLVERLRKNGDATRYIDRGSDVPLVASLAQMKEIHAKWNLIASKCVNDSNLWPCVEVIADILFRESPPTSKYGEVTPAGASLITCADELSALLAQHAVAEPQVSVPMREWLKAKRIELSAEQLWAVESYLVMNVLPIAPAHAAEQPKLTATQIQKAFRDAKACEEWDPELFWNNIAQDLNALLLTSPVAPPPPEPRNWKGVRWIDSINARNLAEEIGLHFAHDCNDSMCGEDADASNCEVAWIEDKLVEFLDAQAAPPVAPGEQPPVGHGFITGTAIPGNFLPAQERASDEEKSADYKWAKKWLYGHNSNDYYAKELAEEIAAIRSTAAKLAREEALEEHAIVWELRPQSSLSAGDEIRLERRDGFKGRRWAVTQRGFVLNKDGDWEYEPIPSSRTEGWLESVRWEHWKDAVAALAAQPSTQTKEEEK